MIYLLPLTFGFLDPIILDNEVTRILKKQVNATIELFYIFFIYWSVKQALNEAQVEFLYLQLQLLRMIKEVLVSLELIFKVLMLILANFE